MQWQHIMGQLIVCIGTTQRREKKVQFGGHCTTTSSLPPHIWGIGTRVMGMVWREMADIVGVPGRDLFMMEIMDCSGLHRDYMEPHWLYNGSPCIEPYLLFVCVCLCCVLGDFHCRLPEHFPFSGLRCTLCSECFLTMNVHRQSGVDLVVSS